MSTRCNIKITAPDHAPLYLYRHWDGYLAETGANVVEVVRKPGQWETWSPWLHLVNGFLSQIYEETEHAKPHPIYEVTDRAHGDIEHFYWIEISSSAITIHHAAGYGEELESKTTPYTLEEFAAIVNADRQDANTRIGQLRRTSPAYADAELYPML
ncbi:MAG: hypothetical protein A2V88_05050 [Elusimicrobia bacterium RBG_16_66_12]|nr:MAG: hypothetical protein A2V88_05050 [Elusimicrobia bacterium RBG_16_66_12]